MCGYGQDEVNGFCPGRPPTLPRIPQMTFDDDDVVGVTTTRTKRKAPSRSGGTRSPTTPGKSGACAPELQLLASMEAGGRAPARYTFSDPPALSQLGQGLDSISKGLQLAASAWPALEAGVCGRPPCLPSQQRGTPAAAALWRLRRRRDARAGPATSCRYDSSLGLLTKKFIELVDGALDGVLDLNKAAESLSVRPALCGPPRPT